ncbi:MAG: hypothetical protein SGJ05_11285 [bacterium]|nr:hypothetical protein [bacterium]
MNFLKTCAIAALTLGTSMTVAYAGIRCDEHAKKASTTKASSGCATKTTKVSTASTLSTECTTAEKQACTDAEKQACAKNVKMTSVKKVKSGSSCCASKVKDVKTASAEAVATPAQAQVVHTSVQPVTPNK